jgi:hypothetical protein
VHSLKVKAPSSQGPKTVRIFKNQPRTLDFSQAESMISIQVWVFERFKILVFNFDIGLGGVWGPAGWEREPLKYVKFQDVQNIQFFVKDNQTGDEVTQIDHLEIFGTPKQTTNMKDLKKAG